MGQRSLYYWAKLYHSTLRRGEDYAHLRRTISINLLGYTYLPLKGFHHMYGLYDETGEHRLTEDLEIHFLELPKVTRTDIRQMRTLDKWMAFIGNKLSNEEMEEIAMSEAAINMAWDRIETFMRDAGRRRKYEQREKYEHDYVSDMNGSRREGLAEGLAKGRAEGRAEGRREGRAEGRAESARSTASALIGLGKLSIEQIAAATQLPIEEVERLADMKMKSL